MEILDAEAWEGWCDLHFKSTCQPLWRHHHQNGQFVSMEVSAWTHTGTPHRWFEGQAFLLGSHHHLRFFDAYGRVVLKSQYRPGNLSTSMTGLDLRHLHDVIYHLKKTPSNWKDPLVKELRSYLTPEDIDKLPYTFQVGIPDYTQHALCFIDTRTFRWHIPLFYDPAYDLHQSDLLRQVFRFKIYKWCDDGNFPHTYNIMPGPTRLTCHKRCIENELVEEQSWTSPWPQRVTLPLTQHPWGEQLQQQGVWWCPVQPPLFREVIQGTHHYLKTLLHLDPTLDLSQAAVLQTICHQRVKDDVPLFHIVGHEESTHYGHFCSALSEFFQQLKPLVQRVLGFLGTYMVATSDVAFHFVDPHYKERQHRMFSVRDMELPRIRYRWSEANDSVPTKQVPTEASSKDERSTPP